MTISTQRRSVVAQLVRAGSIGAGAITLLLAGQAAQAQPTAHGKDGKARAILPPAGANRTVTLAVASADIRHYFALTVASASGGGREVRLERRAGNAEPEAGQTIAAVPIGARAAPPVRLRVVARGGA